MTLSEVTVLVVDDEPILRLTLGLLLQRQGATVHRAANGLEALTVLGRQGIDLMLTDRQMPVMDGMALLHSMATEGIRMPTVLFTQNDAESPATLEALGVVRTLSKPTHPEDLIQAITDALQPLPSRL